MYGSFLLDSVQSSLMYLHPFQTPIYFDSKLWGRVETIVSLKVNQSSPLTFYLLHIAYPTKKYGIHTNCSDSPIIYEFPNPHVEIQQLQI